ncbi:MAG: SAM-dependent methyltransferase [Deltaproteobacteria bacterium RIFCSPHIGHO2_02_FULL_44_16]|nr:MAG: SAM-dependent methyltransferase [Deltaproteobacteria bacterium RIFCSPHIGHO2_02_FULL_44_16]
MTPSFPILKLKKREERRIEAGHLWIFSNEIDTEQTPLKQFEPGQLVAVESANGKKIGTAYVNPHSLICARLMSRKVEELTAAWFIERFQKALHLRERFYAKPFYRLLFAEGDCVPGLIVDRYGDVLVAQISTAGMERCKTMIVEALCAVLKPKSILWRNDVSLRELEGLSFEVAAAYGDPPKEVFLTEHETTFHIPIWEGQKTGWFFDQHENRAWFLKHVRGKRILDVFSYIGAWGVEAAVHGAKEVVCVDSSQTALHWLTQNAERNQVTDRVKIICDDAFDVLRALVAQKKMFDVVVVDPPAFIKRQKDMSAGFKAYQRLNQLALSLLPADGLLMSASCSMHLSDDDFMNMLFQASDESGNTAQLLWRGGQASDHPVHLAIPETRYLKCAVLHT